MADKLVNDQRFRTPTAVSHFDRFCPVLRVDHSFGATKLIEALETAERAGKRLPKAITVDDCPDFAGQILSARTCSRGLQLDIIRPGKPTENGYTESFNSKLGHKFWISRLLPREIQKKHESYRLKP